MSNKRKRINAAKYTSHLHGKKSIDIHIPTASSNTIREGSSPHSFSSKRAEYAPNIVKRTINPKSKNCENGRYETIQYPMSKPPALPTVPGATGDKPHPKNVTKILLILIQIFIIIQSEVSDQILSLQITQCIFKFY